MKYYGVRRGRHIGVYSTWEDCRSQVERYAGAQYKAFPTRKAAETYAYSSLDPRHHSSEPMPSPQGDFTVDSRIHAWVDGSCLQQPNGSLLIGWAYLIIDKGKEIHREAGNEIPEGAQQHRNVAGEIVAVLKAVSWCQSQGISLITVYHDYQGLASWSTGEWKTKTPLTQYYAHTIGTSGLDIHWKKVKAHSGEPNNELVDQLAKEAALKPEKRKYQKPL